MYEKEKMNRYLNRLKKTARNSWIISIFLLIVILTLIHSHSTSSNNMMLPKQSDTRLLVHDRFKDRLETIDSVCAEENLKYDFDLRSHIPQ